MHNNSNSFIRLIIGLFLFLSFFAASSVMAQPNTQSAGATGKAPPPSEYYLVNPPAGLPKQESVEDELHTPVFAEKAKSFRFIRNVGFSATWLPGSGDDLGQTSVRLHGSVFIPAPLAQSAFVVTPNFGVDFLDGPQTSDLPPRLYRASASVSWMCKPSPYWSVNIGVTPGVSSDFKASGSDAFRMTGHVMATYQWSPEWQFLFGVVYLNRNDLNVLPMAGAIWTPHEDLRIELTVPRPRIARRIWLPWDIGGGGENWLYLAGGIGGGTWAIRRTSGIDDEVTIRDFRVLVGLERNLPSGKKFRLESGFVFARKIEYESGTPDIEPSDTVFLSAGWAY